MGQKIRHDNLNKTEDLNNDETSRHQTEQPVQGEAKTNESATSTNDPKEFEDPESFQNVCMLLERLVPRVEKRKKIILTILWTLYTAHTKAQSNNEM